MPLSVFFHTRRKRPVHTAGFEPLPNLAGRCVGLAFTTRAGSEPNSRAETKQARRGATPGVLQYATVAPTLLLAPGIPPSKTFIMLDAGGSSERGQRFFFFFPRTFPPASGHQNAELVRELKENVRLTLPRISCSRLQLVCWRCRCPFTAAVSPTVRSICSLPLKWGRCNTRMPKHQFSQPSPRLVCHHDTLVCPQGHSSGSNWHLGPNLKT